MKEIVHIDFFGCISSTGQNKIDFKYLSAHSFVGTKNFVKFVLHLTCGFNDPNQGGICSNPVKSLNFFLFFSFRLFFTSFF